MKFIDQTDIEVHAGDGGNGIVAFRREARVSRGGPSGGDGGNGGSIYFVGDPGMNTLLSAKLTRIVRGNEGGNGRNKDQTGANGKDVIFKVPFGTLVYFGKKLICDVIDEEKYLVATGGKGGRGNSRFKSARNTAPTLSENGTKGESFDFSLELKVLADVGFVGKPSAGKSTILAKVSNAKPKIADYSFTTLTPQLGFVHVDENSFVAADLPGLIEGASQGKGLGYEFLRHIERCRVIAHIIDFGSEEKNPIEDYVGINKELKDYKLGLDDRAQVVIANKSDLPLFKEHLEIFKKKFPKVEVVEVSAMTETNIMNAKRALYQAFITSNEIEYKHEEEHEVTIELEDDVIVNREILGLFDVTGAAVERIYQKIPLTTSENFMRFNKLMKDIGVWDELRRQGIENDDTVRIFGYEFEWRDE